MAIFTGFRELRKRLATHCEHRSIKRRLFAEHWKRLPEELKTEQQVAGIGGIACGATHSIMEKCNFACTSCYLSELANYTESLPFAEVREQLRLLRRHLGPGGKVQITSGEVTLLPKEELGRIVTCAREMGLDPMVMTNGQRFLQVPDYLPTLVTRYGLEKISIHIDTTQRGRPGMAPGLGEKQINPIRDRFARLIEEVRRSTGRHLHAAHTITVTQKNFADIPEVVRWALDHAGAFRLLSFLPVAEVGRTQDERIRRLTLEAVWEKVCEGAGRRLYHQAMLFGHPGCNIIAPVVVVSFAGRHELVEMVRAHRKWDVRIFRRALREFALDIDLNVGFFINVLKLLQPTLRRLDLLAELLFYSLYRLWGERRWLGSFAWQLLTLHRVRIKPLLFVVHKFMSSDELDTPEGRERLSACVFKLPLDGRMVSMCEMNGTQLRRRLNLEHLTRVHADRLATSRTG